MDAAESTPIDAGAGKPERSMQKPQIIWLHVYDLGQMTELLDFALAWQLDQGCLDFLQTQDAETQRFVVNNFQPKEGTANISGLFMSYVNSLVRAGKGGKGMR